MGDILTGICEKCKKSGPLNRVDEIFHFPCKCHSPSHFIIHYLCDKCKEDFRVSPNKRCDVILSRKTFNLIMKAHEKYHEKFGNVRLDNNTMKPNIVFNKLTCKMEIHLHCTHKVLTYIDDLYVQWTADHPEKPSKDYVVSDTQTKD